MINRRANGLMAVSERLCETIQLLQDREYITVRDLANHIGSEWQTARRYIDVVSLYWPVYEDGHDKGTRRPATKYKIIK